MEDPKLNQNASINRRNASVNRRFSFRRLNTMSTFCDVDIDCYLDYIKDELVKLEYTIDQRMFPDHILTILDKLLANNNQNGSGSFSRIIFNYIIEFGSFKPDSPIMLYNKIL